MWGSVNRGAMQTTTPQATPVCTHNPGTMTVSKHEGESNMAAQETPDSTVGILLTFQNVSMLNVRVTKSYQQISLKE